MNHKKKQALWITSVFGIIFTLDQITKAIVIRNIEPHAPYRGDIFFHFTHQRNTGIMGGAFSDVPMVAYIAPVFAFAVLIYMYTQLNLQSRLQALAYGMVMGGALGNILDRIRLGSVTDFLQFHFYFIPFDFPWKYYPAFNIADAGIMVGITLLFITLTKNSESKEHVPGDI